jgi:ribosomal RNA methyltransferase Nop2
VGGILVYSTCSFSVEENEGVIDYILKKFNVKILDCNVEVENKIITRFKGKIFSE